MRQSRQGIDRPYRDRRSLACAAVIHATRLPLLSFTPTLQRSTARFVPTNGCFPRTNGDERSCLVRVGVPRVAIVSLTLRTRSLELPGNADEPLDRRR
jgi:hypothetical protein